MRSNRPTKPVPALMSSPETLRKSLVHDAAMQKMSSFHGESGSQ